MTKVVLDDGARTIEGPGIRRLTQGELRAEARAAFGDDPALWAFRCPRCGDVATVRDFVNAGAGDRAGQECIGRVAGVYGRGCDWAAYGLLAGPWFVTQPERTVPCFPLAVSS